VTQLSFFGPNEAGPDPKPDGDAPVRLRLLITVKAAPNPSEKYGETVCVAALSIDPLRPGWVRLYPINHRELTSDDRFRKYEIISVMARPARRDQRRESWKPIIETIAREAYLPPWEKRRRYLDPWVEESMCRLNRAVRDRPDAQSLALIRPARVDGLRVTPHGGWTPSEQRKIDAYVSQLDLLDNRDRVPLEAPRFRAAYRYQCHEPGCKGHLQGLLDWELVALQRRLRGFRRGTQAGHRGEVLARTVRTHPGCRLLCGQPGEARERVQRARRVLAAETPAKRFDAASSTTSRWQCC
jgi:hypothetical protein